MLDERYLEMGIDALSRAEEADYFADGHRGGAILSAYFFCRENAVEDGARQAIAAKIDAEYAQLELVAPFPREAAEPELLTRLSEALGKSMGRLREAGHNVILPTLALKGLGQNPELATPARIEGLCSLVGRFSISDVPLSETEVPDLEDLQSWSEFVLGEFLHSLRLFDGRGQGWSGHLLTYGRALLDLTELGHSDLARAEGGFKEFVRRLRLGPQETDRRRREHRRTRKLPHQAAYWPSRRRGALGLGHALKYPYGFYGLMSHARDEALKEACLSEAFRIF